MKKVPLFYLDAFTDKPFKGNPIAVCLTDKNFDYNMMQSIAEELNLSETAFVYPLDETDDFAKAKYFSLKWFTPTDEVKLCGHGTLGTSALIFDYFENINDEIFFETLSGKHSVKKDNNWFWLNFPKYVPELYELNNELKEALGLEKYHEAYLSKEGENLLINIGDSIDIRKIEPDFYKLKKVNLPYVGGIILTQQSKDNKYDFLSRYFTPWYGINEDPVTGSSFSVLAPYWNNLLNKYEMNAFQASKRGGQVKLILDKTFPDRVFIGGQAIQTIKGEFLI